MRAENALFMLFGGRKMQIKIGETTFVLTEIKARMVRKAVSFAKDIDANNLTAENLDMLVAFVCECYENKFTVDDVYDNLSSKDLIPTIVNTIQYINGSMGEP